MCIYICICVYVYIYISENFFLKLNKQKNHLNEKNKTKQNKIKKTIKRKKA